MLICLKVFSIVVFLGTMAEACGHHIINGRLLDPYLTPIPGIGTYSWDTVPLANTDMEGYFELKDAPKDLLIVGLGYQWTKINL